MGRLRRDRGISVARPTVLGNPFKIGPDGDRAEVIRKYRRWLLIELNRDPRVRQAIERITMAARGGDIKLLCFCAPNACHAEVIADVVRERIRRDALGRDRL